jgi:hypothetical protein
MRVLSLVFCVASNSTDIFTVDRKYSSTAISNLTSTRGNKSIVYIKFSHNKSGIHSIFIFLPEGLYY